LNLCFRIHIPGGLPSCKSLSPPPCYCAPLLSSPSIVSRCDHTLVFLSPLVPLFLCVSSVVSFRLFLFEWTTRELRRVDASIGTTRTAPFSGTTDYCFTRKSPPIRPFHPTLLLLLLLPDAFPNFFYKSLPFFFHLVSCLTPFPLDFSLPAFDSAPPPLL